MDELKYRIRSYWTRRASSFELQRQREFDSEKKDKWLAEIQHFLPENAPLDILDIGTGTGFFALLLAKEHHVLGIDLSEEMIRRAKTLADREQLKASFEVMDAERPSLSPESFDVLVTRNLTWTMAHLDSAYHSWYNLLRPGGVLINFDADYCGVTASARDAEVALPKHHAHQSLSPELLDENEEITLELSAYQKPRPAWDLTLLLESGFERVVVDTGIWRRIYAKQDEFYNPVPIFALAAYKKALV
ncbi:MAG: class I SAM-dependent methyltransferase [Lachnospiraceae bacterium]|nr:class I SAM-dependent methyltransferase [Lachnospiraceae bacterium]